MSRSTNWVLPDAEVGAGADSGTSRCICARNGRLPVNW